MSKNIQIQKNITDHLFNRNDGSFAEPLINSDLIDPLTRLDVHRQTVLENLVNSLRIIYPGIWNLVGDECAKGLALSYIHQENNLPKNGAMLDYGKNFPEHIRDFPSVKHLIYLADYAKLEWEHYDSYHARIEHKLGFEDLTQFEEEQLAHSHFALNNSVRFVSSNFDLLAIMNIVENPGSESISLKGIPSYYLLFQQNGRVVTKALQEKEWNFLKDLASGKPFGETAETYSKYSSFDLASVINLIITNGLLENIVCVA